MFVSWPLVTGSLLLQLVSTSFAAVTVSTFAGESAYNNDNDPSALGEILAFPFGVAIDASGTVFVTESRENQIRKITPDGIVSTMNVNWNTHDVASTRHIAVDGHGNIFMTHHRGNRIYRITPDGNVSVYTGGDASGYVDGPARTARFNGPKGIAIDLSGNLIVVDSGNHCIRKITPDGMVSTLAGTGRKGLHNGPGAHAQFDSPSCIAVDPHGDLYVVDDRNHCIRKITPDEIVSRFSGLQRMSTRNSASRVSPVKAPKGIAVDANGNVYATEWFDSLIYKITPDGDMSVVAGDGNRGYVNGPGHSSRFSTPTGIVIDNDGNLLVADSWNHRIRKISFTSGGNDDQVLESYGPVKPRPIRYNKDECAICYDVKRDNDKYDYCSISCGNTFHKRCINRCMARAVNKKCPMCRSEWILNKPPVAIPTASSEEDEE